MSELVKQISDASFQQDVLESEKPVVVDFWAPWCGPCKMVSPIIEDLAEEYAGEVSFCKVNTDENVETAGQLGIRGIPTIIFYTDGQEVDRVVGFAPKPAFKERIDSMLAKAKAE